MNKTVIQESGGIASYISQQVLFRRLADTQWQWWQSRWALLSSPNRKDLDITIGLIPRKLGKADLELSDEETLAMQGLRPQLDASHWSIDVAARIAVLQTYAQQHLAADEFGELFVALCQSADLAESLALYAGIAVFPDSKMLSHQVGEGLRSNVSAIFEAVAHRNPYPAETFDEHRWNHMILKALFIGSKLQPIQGLDERANEELAQVLCNYAHERWAAHRPVNPELWRCVAPYATGQRLADLRHACDNGSDAERAGAILALSQVGSNEAEAAMTAYPDHQRAIAAGNLTWLSISEQLETVPADIVAAT